MTANYIIAEALQNLKDTDPAFQFVTDLLAVPGNSATHQLVIIVSAGKAFYYDIRVADVLSLARRNETDAIRQMSVDLGGRFRHQILKHAQETSSNR